MDWSKDDRDRIQAFIDQWHEGIRRGVIVPIPRELLDHDSDIQDVVEIEEWLM